MQILPICCTALETEGLDKGQPPKQLLSYSQMSHLTASTCCRHDDQLKHFFPELHFTKSTFWLDHRLKTMQLVWAFFINFGAATVSSPNVISVLLGAVKQDSNNMLLVCLKPSHNSCRGHYILTLLWCNLKLTLHNWWYWVHASVVKNARHGMWITQFHKCIVSVQNDCWTWFTTTVNFRLYNQGGNAQSW